MLTPPQRLLFARLAIFTASWDAEEASVIMTKSLRAYALELLRAEGDLERLATRHAGYMAELDSGRLPPAFTPDKSSVSGLASLN